MNEIQLQSEIVRKFSELFYPKERGQLFHVSNERNSKNQAFQAKSIGVFAGVSDFLYMKKFHPRENGSESTFLLGIEVKAPNTYHSKDHLMQQIEWGKILENCGGKWVLVTSVEAAMESINGNYSNCLNLEQVSNLIKNCKNKNLKF